MPRARDTLWALISITFTACAAQQPDEPSSVTEQSLSGTLPVALEVSDDTTDPSADEPNRDATTRGAPRSGFLDLAWLERTRWSESSGWIGWARERLSDEGTTFAEVSPGREPGAPTLTVNPRAIAGAFEGQEFSPAPDGVYTIRSFAVSSADCGRTGLVPTLESEPTSAEPSPDGEPISVAGTEAGTRADPTGLQGGICAPLSVAHSLVNVLGVVDPAWGGVTVDWLSGGARVSGLWWHPGFLKQVVRVGDQGTGNRSLSDDETTQAHTADWSSDYEVYVSHARDEVTRDDQIERQRWCLDLALRKASGDDCVLRLENDDDAHLMSIRDVTWNPVSGNCDIVTDDTGKQDSERNDFLFVPASPGEQTWSVGAGLIFNVRGAASNFWNGQGFDRATFWCYAARLKPGATGANPRPGAAWSQR
ncbi:MAG: hypothetical protein IT379_00730 [Deltaproteobacteria bacterium]|nr:hypothetical protein [Deltaproteobacteria bacterium]